MPPRPNAGARGGRGSNTGRLTRPSRNAIRDKAVAFAHEWKDDTSESGEYQVFWTDFLEVFGVERRRTNAAFQRHAHRTSTGGGGFIDLLWPGMLLAEHKSRGEDLDQGMDQALDYIDSLSDLDLPTLVVVCDFERMMVVDLSDPDRGRQTFLLEDLPREIDRLLGLAGYTTRRFDETDAINVKAAELLGKLHDELEATGYEGHQLRVFLVRVLFLLFGDDAGLWPKKQFADFIVNRTNEDGSDLGLWIAHLFDVLDQPEDSRRTSLDVDLAAFPYVNGGLYAERIETPDTNRTMRERLLAACAFDWSQISPAIFGAMFQSVMKMDERHAVGAHYTSEQAILKVIEPLFLDELRSELASAGQSAARLRALHDKIGQLTFFDPACGCGNFLVVAYRELRRLELDILKALHERAHVQLTLDLSQYRKVSPDQLYGIEIEEFPARIAETAVYLVDHLENEALGRAFGLSVVDLPLGPTAHIHTDNALRMDWSTVLAPDEARYVFGNPPFVAKGDRDDDQQSDMRSVFGSVGSGDLDYVCAWYAMASRYLKGTTAKVAFVSTNSISQGEQVALLWQPLLDDGADLGFAHRTFAWTSEARNRAHVHVVIEGFSMTTWEGKKTLFDYPDLNGPPVASVVSNISPYLIEGPPVVVARRSQPFAGMPRASFGSMPNDGGHLLLTDSEAEELRHTDPVAASFLREMLSTRELLRGAKRWCLWLDGAPSSDLRSSPELRRRIEGVRRHREASERPATKVLADVPYRFGEVRQPTTPYLCVPRHVSENYAMIPMLFCQPEQIAHDSTITIPGADLALFGLLQSSMFDAWQRVIGGRIKSDVRFAVEVTYNTFPYLEPSQAQHDELSELGQAVLDARSADGGPLVALYAPDSMPERLVLAHRELDRAVDRIYSGRRTGLRDDGERLRLLLERYQVLVAEEGT